PSIRPAPPFPTRRSSDLVPGSKETRVAEAVSGPHVLVAGHPFVDVWQAVKPRAVGLVEWPDVPKGQSWKEGACRALGVSDPAAADRKSTRLNSSHDQTSY